MCEGENGFKLMPRVILICSCIKKKNVAYESNYSIEQPRPKVVKSNLRKGNQLVEYYFTVQKFIKSNKTYNNLKLY